MAVFIIQLVQAIHLWEFAPDEGETWEIPNQGQKGRLKIFNQQRQLVYEQVIEFSGKYSWDGRSNSGYILSMGLYQFILDFENGEQVLGNVTIIR